MSWTHISDTKPKARRDYRCELCGLTIPKGIVHVKRVGADGELISFRMHVQCDEATRKWSFEEWENTEPWTFRNEDLAGEILSKLLIPDKYLKH